MGERATNGDTARPSNHGAARVLVGRRTHSHRTRAAMPVALRECALQQVCSTMLMTSAADVEEVRGGEYNYLPSPYLLL